MTTTSTIPDIPAVTDHPCTGCGPDCVYIDGACRCYHGEAIPAELVLAWMQDIAIPF